MNKNIGKIKVELSGDTIFIRDIKTGTLLKAKSYRASEVVEEYDKLIVILQEREKQKTINILTGKA
ncbi:hypothetical protein N8Z10_01075 [bacterium]|nr:hypothetical protein [bacterium]